jgi:hypothetical protein
LEKRRRDQVRRQKQQNKRERRAKRDAERPVTPAVAVAGKDPDLEGMVAGLQPGQILDVDA